MILRAVLVSVALFVACSDTPPPASCGALAPPACPEDNGADVCTDPTCASVYACQNGTWSFVKDCPNYNPEAGPQPADASSDADAGSTPDVTFDAPPGSYGGPGCTDLEQPDCSVGTAIACANTPDCCGCQDLYVCVSGGWTLWGECTDAGIVPNGQ